MLNRKNIIGLTLLEIIIVLGIMGVIAAGVVILAQRAIDNQNATKMNATVNTLQTSMVQTFRSQGSYPVSTTEAQSDQLLTALEAMGKISNTDKINAFTGGKLFIFSTAVNGVANKAFLIKLADLTQSQCAEIVSSVQELVDVIDIKAAPSTTITDVFAPATADTGLGLIKSLSGTGNQFNISDLDQISKLCDTGTAGSANKHYDVYVGR